jgi:hypothetical protein
MQENNNKMGGCRLYSTSSGQKQVGKSGENGNKSSSFIKCRKSDELRTHQLLKMDPILWS